ncbi:hypothetical protein ACIQU5_31475 [Streptomyces sp. NPDC090306]|uniref:hypothetical protein n=1 Tax=Streptomyces sp. NPDC090306 TaxID=3365961 RepID=UPI00381BD787
MSSWYQHWTDQDLRAMPRKGEELVCLYANVAVQPSWLVYSPGDGSVVHTEFGEGFSSVIPGGVEGRPAQLERAMRDNGAVWPGSQAFASPAAWQQFVERHSPGLHGAVWRSIGDFLGVTLVRSDIEQGLLPVALLTDPFG